MRVAVFLFILADLIAIGVGYYFSLVSPTLPTGDRSVPSTERGSVRGYLTPKEHRVRSIAKIFCIAEPATGAALLFVWSRRKDTNR
jgi:hypothetical protein